MDRSSAVALFRHKAEVFNKINHSKRDGGDFRHACIVGNVAEVKRLIEEKIDVNWQGPEHELPTALECACLYGHTEIVKILLSHRETGITVSALSTAAKYNRIEIFKLFLQAKSFRYAGDFNDSVMKAIQSGHLEILKLAMGTGALTQNGDVAQLVLPKVAETPHNHILVYLLREYPEAAIKKAIAQAVAKNRLENINTLLESKRSFNAALCFHIASSHGYFHATQLLLQKASIHKSHINYKLSEIKHHAQNVTLTTTSVNMCYLCLQHGGYIEECDEEIAETISQILLDALDQTALPDDLQHLIIEILVGNSLKITG